MGRLNRLFVPFARFALFTIYFWFGLLKILGVSPASELVDQVQATMFPFLPEMTMCLIFAIFEMAIGISFLIPKWRKLSFVLLLIHMGCTLLPLIFLPHVCWQSLLVPTFTGQYIIKNLAIIACAIGVAGSSMQSANA